MMGGENLKFEYSKDADVSDNSMVYVRKMNHIYEVLHLQTNKNGLDKIKKISKSEYVILESGEVMEYQVNDNRGESVESLKETMKKLRYLINNNFTGGEGEIHLTLTYAENMTDTTRLYKDYKRFWMRFIRKYGNEFEYLSVIEPQERGAWHCHVLIKTRDGTRLYIPSDDIEKLWGNGFVKIKRLEEVDNIGAYLSAYLCNAEADDEDIERICKLPSGSETNIFIKDTQEGKKGFIKGKRLKMYPLGINIFRHSKGIIYPEKQEMNFEELKKIVGSATPNYTRVVKILDDDNKFLNKITYLNYNTKR